MENVGISESIHIVFHFSKLFCPKLQRVFSDSLAIVCSGMYMRPRTLRTFVCIYYTYVESKFCEGRQLRERGNILPPVCCLSVVNLEQKLLVIPVLLCFVSRKNNLALLSIPETLTCDVYRLNPRVRLLGAASRAFASWKFGGTFFFSRKQKQKKRKFV